MSITNYKKADPVLLDKVIQDMQEMLEGNLPWLDKAFGRAFKIVEHQLAGQKFVYPAVYSGDGEYLSVLPDDKIGNFSFFEIYDPQGLSPVVQGRPKIEFNGALVFWFDLTSIYSDSKMLYTEEVKDEILSVLTTPGAVSSGRFSLNSIIEKPENVYKGYTLEKIYNNFQYSGQNIESMDKQYFMFPYAALRFEFTITTQELCSRYKKP